MTPFGTDEVASHSAFSPGYLTEVLTSLVQARSVNPGDSEAEVAAVISRWLKLPGVETTIVETLPGRPSIAAVIRGRGDGPRLVLNGHMDTHPLDDLALWTVNPFDGTVRDGFMYGRGACDMKAGLTAQIAVARYLAEAKPDLRGSLILHFAM